MDNIAAKKSFNSNFQCLSLMCLENDWKWYRFCTLVGWLMAHRLLRDAEADGWERSDFPIICESCLGDSPYVRMVTSQSVFEFWLYWAADSACLKFRKWMYLSLWDKATFGAHYFLVSILMFNLVWCSSSLHCPLHI